MAIFFALLILCSSFVFPQQDYNTDVYLNFLSVGGCSCGRSVGGNVIQTKALSPSREFLYTSTAVRRDCKSFKVGGGLKGTPPEMQIA